MSWKQLITSTLTLLRPKTIKSLTVTCYTESASNNHNNHNTWEAWGYSVHDYLHGIEASFLAVSSLRRLRSSFFKVAWSRRQPLANTNTMLSLLDGPQGCDPAYCVFFRCRMIRSYLAHRPSAVSRVYRLLERVMEWGLGHGPIHLLVASAAEFGFLWDHTCLVGCVLGCLS